MQSFLKIIRGKLEEGGRAFYETLAFQTIGESKENLQEFFNTLAREETAHREIFQKIYDQMKSESEAESSISGKRR